MDLGAASEESLIVRSPYQSEENSVNPAARVGTAPLV